MEYSPINNHHQPAATSTDLHVVTENGEQCFMWRSNQLTYIAQDRQELPEVLATKFGSLATKLDLSYNTLTSYRNINQFTNISELILDNNLLEDDHLDFKQNLRLKTLSINKNKVCLAWVTLFFCSLNITDLLCCHKRFHQLTDLYRLVSKVKVCFPNLEFLSLIGNPLCPGSVLCNLTLRPNDGAIHSKSNQSSYLVDLSRTKSAGEVIEPKESGLVASPQLRAVDDQHPDYAHQKYR